MQFVQVLFQSIEALLNQLVTYIPQIIIALLIWWIGLRLLNLAAKFIKKIDIPQTDWDEKVIDLLVKITIPLGKFILILIILDYLGIGRTVISAITTGLTFTIAIALGISFGKALEPEAETIVRHFRKHIKK